MKLKKQSFIRFHEIIHNGPSPMIHGAACKLLHMKTLYTLIISSFLVAASCAQEGWEAGNEVSVFTETSIKIDQILHEPPVVVSYGKVEDDEAVADGQLRKCLTAQFFPVAWPNITYQEWRECFASDAFKTEDSAKRMYDATREKFPSPESYKSNKMYASLGNRFLVQEIKLEIADSKFWILVLGYDPADSEKVSYKVFVWEGGKWKIAGGIPDKMKAINFPWNINRDELQAWRDGCAVVLKSGRIVFLPQSIVGDN